MIAFSVPTLVDGSVNKELKKLFSKKSDYIIVIDDLTQDIINKFFKKQRTYV